VELPVATNQSTSEVDLDLGDPFLPRSESKSFLTTRLWVMRSYFLGLFLRFTLCCNRVEVDPETPDSVVIPQRRLLSDLSLNLSNKQGLEDECAKIIYPVMDGISSQGRSYDNIMIRDFSEKEEEVADFTQKTGRVLIVDDVPMNRKMLKRLLTSRFYECEEAENGQQAVDMVREAMVAGMSYDMITMDYQMPVMDGVTATCSIRKLGYTGHIVGVTGNALAEDVDCFLSKGANIVLTKPLSIVKLDEYLSNVD